MVDVTVEEHFVSWLAQEVASIRDCALDQVHRNRRRIGWVEPGVIEQRSEPVAQGVKMFAAVGDPQNRFAICAHIAVDSRSGISMLGSIVPGWIRSSGMIGIDQLDHSLAMRLGQRFDLRTELRGRRPELKHHVASRGGCREQHEVKAQCRRFGQVPEVLSRASRVEQ